LYVNIFNECFGKSVGFLVWICEVYWNDKFKT
jgi:hypothetical protein